VKKCHEIPNFEIKEPFLSHSDKWNERCTTDLVFPNLGRQCSNPARETELELDIVVAARATPSAVCATMIAIKVCQTNHLVGAKSNLQSSVQLKIDTTTTPHTEKKFFHHSHSNSLQSLKPYLHQNSDVIHRLTSRLPNLNLTPI